ncbi:hypothetical protein T4E_7639 [Trichinella pseudospiralis]|uniref:Uncharacterized protein n=1 Tax=Trichinella pseudospiralis TaxID=6337 RepID=A0A0V0XZP1_TRIPS|nr:hypothetical protein T4E_7639 [Trichinella pseudospiralis]
MEIRTIDVIVVTGGKYTKRLRQTEFGECSIRENRASVLCWLGTLFNCPLAASTVSEMSNSTKKTHTNQ